MMITRFLPKRAVVTRCGFLILAVSLAWPLEAAANHSAASGVRVEVAVPNAAALPTGLTAIFSSELAGLLASGEIDGANSDTVHGEIDCRSESGAVWWCEVPPGEWNLRLSAAGSSSALRLRTVVSTGQTTDLGRVTLVRGAAILGRLILSEDLHPDQVDLALTVEPASESTAAPPQLPRRTPFQEQGFFQFRDLPPGTYRVTARASGWATAQEGPVVVFKDGETILPRALEMLRVAQLELCLEPSVPPGVRRSTDTWVPTLERTDGISHVSAGGCSSEDGCWQWVDIQPGRYELVVADGRHSQWLRRAVELSAGPTRLDLEVPLIPVEGTILLSGQPVRARLTFEKHDLEEGAESRTHSKIVLYSDVHGNFEGSLPEEGRWLVKAAFSAAGPEQLVAVVDVEKLGEKNVMRFDFDAGP